MRSAPRVWLALVALVGLCVLGRSAVAQGQQFDAAAESEPLTNAATDAATIERETNALLDSVAADLGMEAGSVDGGMLEADSSAAALAADDLALSDATDATDADAIVAAAEQSEAELADDEAAIAEFLGSSEPLTAASTPGMPPPVSAAAEPASASAAAATEIDNAYEAVEDALHGGASGHGHDNMRFAGAGADAEAAADAEFAAATKEFCSLYADAIVNVVEDCDELHITDADVAAGEQEQEQAEADGADADASAGSSLMEVHAAHRRRGLFGALKRGAKKLLGGGKGLLKGALGGLGKVGKKLGAIGKLAMNGIGKIGKLANRARCAIGRAKGVANQAMGLFGASDRTKGKVNGFIDKISAGCEGAVQGPGGVPPPPAPGPAPTAPGGPPKPFDLFGKPVPRPIPPPAIPQPRVIHPLPPIYNQPGKCPETCHGHGQCLLDLTKLTLSRSGNTQIHPYKCFCDVGWVGNTCGTPVDAYLKYFLTHGRAGHPPCCRVCRSQREPLDRYARIPYATDLIDPMNPFFTTKESDTVAGSRSKWQRPFHHFRGPQPGSNTAAARLMGVSSFLAVAEAVQRSKGSSDAAAVSAGVRAGATPRSSGAMYDWLMKVDTTYLRRRLHEAGVSHSLREHLQSAGVDATAFLESGSDVEAGAAAGAASDSEGEGENADGLGANAEKFNLAKLGAWANKALGHVKALLGNKGGPQVPPPAPSAAWKKIAGPGGLLGPNGLPVPPPKNIFSFYPAPVDPMSHPVKPCCVYCDFQEDFPRKSEQKGRWAQRIERLRMAMTRREYEKTQYQNEEGCCLVCPRYDPKQTADNSQSFNQRGHFPVRPPLRRNMQRQCCDTCPSFFWLKDTSIDQGAFKGKKFEPKDGAPPIADVTPKPPKPQGK